MNSGIFVDLSHTALFGHFFFVYFTDILLVYYSFWFCVAKDSGFVCVSFYYNYSDFCLFSKEMAKGPLWSWGIRRWQRPGSSWGEGKLIRVYCIHFFNQKYISNHLWHLIIWSLLMVLVGEGSGGVALLEVACPGGRPWEFKDCHFKFVLNTFYLWFKIWGLSFLFLLPHLCSASMETKPLEP